MKSRKLDLILHSPGGSAEATEGLVSYIRSKFDDFRVVIPHAAMSAATMMACASDKILMGKHSFIGPIDPQIIATTQLGPQAIPAQAILDQFELAKSDCRSPELLGAWAPILPQYGPALLVQAKESLDLATELVSTWLAKYMLKTDLDPEKKAKEIAATLANHKLFKTHGRHINRVQARGFGLHIDDLEKDQKLQDLVLSIFHSNIITFNLTPTGKIIENHQGGAFIKWFAVPAQPQAVPPVGQPPEGTPAPPKQSPARGRPADQGRPS